MQNNIKKMLVIFPMIFLLCMSFIGTTAKADDKLYNKDSIATTSNKSKENNDLTSTKNENINTNDNKTNNIENKETSKTNTLGPNISGTSPSDNIDKNNEDTATVENNEKATEEVLPVWKTIDGKLYYVTENGVIEKTGWFREKDENPNVDSDNEYYLDENHAAAIGWKQIDGAWYYFDEAGIKQTGWKLINYNWYHLDKHGIMEKGWIKDDGHKYYLNDEGIMTLGKKYINNDWYFLGSDGVLQTGFYTYKGKLYYSNSDGTMVANKWIKTKSNRYYVKADSSLAIGNAVIDKVIENFDENGKYIGPAEKEDYLFIKYLNVGNADCAFIKLPSGDTVLIDTGDVKTSKEVVSFLKDQDLKKEDGKEVIDYIVITHGHSDHIGGLATILENFEVKKVYIPENAKMKDWYSDIEVTKENKTSVEMMKKDYKVFNDAVKAMEDKDKEFTNTKKGEFIDEDKVLQFVQSDKDFGPIGSEKITEDYWGINENSAVIYLNYGDLQALFTADMEWNSEKHFWVNDLLDGAEVDVLKVPHHGSDTSSTPGFLKYLKPSIGIISRGKDAVKKNIAYNNLITNKVSLYETSEKDGVSIYATQENWTVGD